MFQPASTESDSWAPYVVRTLAAKLRLQIMRGDPELNVLRAVFSPSLFGRGDFDIDLHGEPHGLPVQLQVMQRTAPGYVRGVVFHAELSVLAPQAFAPFEILSRKKIPHLVMSEKMALPPCLTGDGSIDARFLVKTADPSLAHRIAGYLEAFRIFESAGVQLVGDGTRITFVMTRDAAPMLASTLCYGDVACEAMTALAHAVSSTQSAYRTRPAHSIASSEPLDDNDQTPIPCQRCGAPMRELPMPHADGVKMQCSFCNAEETLPANRAERVLRLRQRLQEISRAREAREGTAIGIAKVAESYPRMMKPAVIFVACMTAFNFLRSSVSLLMSNSDAWVILGALVSALSVPAVFAAVIGGTTLSLRAYAKELRPLLEAVPSDASSTALRCRCCGAPITAGAGDGAFVTCTFCDAPNLIGDASAAHRASQLERKVERWRNDLHRLPIARAETRA